MAKYCPIVKRKVVYLECLECDTKECQRPLPQDKKKKAKEKNNDCSGTVSDDKYR